MSRINPAGGDGLPVGAEVWIVGTTAPRGYLKQNGATVNRADFPQLWAWAQESGALAASEGAKADGQFGPGDGSTTFSLPDMRGRFPRAWDDGRGIDPGRAFGDYQADTIADHGHTYTGTYVGDGSSTGSPGYIMADDTAPASVTGLSVATEGPNGDVETRPANVTRLACIKYQ